MKHLQVRALPPALRPLPALLALAAAGALLTVACKDPSEGKAQATVSEAKPVPSISQAAGGNAAAKLETLAFDEKAGSVGFIGTKVTGSHEGKLEKLSGSVSLADGKAVGSQVKVTLENSSIAIEPDMLKKHLLGADFFDAEKFP
jgi:polyisoprenoid-binding protein YceI